MKRYFESRDPFLKKSQVFEKHKEPTKHGHDSKPEIQRRTELSSSGDFYCHCRFLFPSPFLCQVPSSPSYMVSEAMRKTMGSTVHRSALHANRGKQPPNSLGAK